MSCALLLWFVLLHAWAFATRMGRGRGFNAYAANLIAIMILAVLSTEP